MLPSSKILYQNIIYICFNFYVNFQILFFSFIFETKQIKYEEDGWGEQNWYTSPLKFDTRCSIHNKAKFYIRFQFLQAIHTHTHMYWEMSWHTDMPHTHTFNTFVIHEILYIYVFYVFGTMDLESNIKVCLLRRVAKFEISFKFINICME